jgi:ABC-type multidrug transport system ATPase subunit
MLELDAVTRRFRDVVAVDGVSFAADRGQIVGLLGHNGAGKTTIVRLLSGLLSPDAGAVRVMGREPVEDGVWVRRRLGVLPSSQLVDLRLTAWENLMFAARVFGLDQREATGRSAELLEDFGVADRMHDRVSTFSAGMRQRVSLARVLLPGPEILLLDEPSMAMDPVAAQEFRGLLREQARAAGRTILICTHDLAEADELCDEVVILSRGRTLLSGDPKRLAADLGTTTTVDISYDAPHRDAAVAVAGAAPAGFEETVPGSLRVTGLDQDTTASLIAGLVAAGVRVYAVEPCRPSLTDLYFALHEDPENETRSL